MITKPNVTNTKKKITIGVIVIAVIVLGNGYMAYNRLFAGKESSDTQATAVKSGYAPIGRFR